MSRGRRDVRRSLTTLLVLGSMTMRLLVFSLLTKMRPVSFAHPARDSAADSTTANARIAKAEMLNGAGNRRGTGTGDPLLLAKPIATSVRLNQAAGQALLLSASQGRQGWGCCLHAI